MNKSFCVKVLTVVGTIGGLFTLGWAIDKHYCTTERHSHFKVETVGMFESMQQQMARDRHQAYVRDLRNQEFYWRQQVATIRGLIRQYPNDPILRQDLQFAMGEVNRLSQAISNATSP